MRLLSTLFLGLSTALAAQWEVLYPNVMTIAIGVSAPDNNNVYVSGSDDGSGAAILKSSDQGNTWESLPHDPQMMYMDIDVAPGTTFGAAPGVAVFGLSAAASITSDGETFTALPEEMFVSASQSVTATDENTFYCVGFFQKTVLGGIYEGLMASFDGGKTTKYYNWGIETSPRYGSFPSNSTWFISGGTWPASESKYNPLKGERQLSKRVLLKKDENGKHKFEINTDPSAMGSFNGYVGVIGRTLDGGNTWTVVFNSTDEYYFNGMHCPTTSKCWAVAEGPAGGYILHSSNADSQSPSWAVQYFGSSNGLFDVKMTSETTGWAVGGEITGQTFNALFLYTNDGGKTWSNTNTVSNAYPNSIAVVSDSRAYATAFLRNGLSSILVYQ